MVRASQQGSPGLRRFLLTPQCSSQGAGMSLPEADTLLLFQHPIISPFNRNPSLSFKTAGYCSPIFNWSTGLGVLSYYCSGLRSVTDKNTWELCTYLFLNFQVISSQVSYFILGTFFFKPFCGSRIHFRDPLRWPSLTTESNTLFWLTEGHSPTKDDYCVLHG